ncbi:MAG: 16S rRNA (guanine(527)-N(7))-methyltransferase RsmG [Lachnospiraceae bacterium]|nr:16S rRNA (guanine(527)-N(7))-methyltransferase RsmG [Lachnospiraceae bacterium]
MKENKLTLSLDKMGIQYSDYQLEQLERYYEMLIERNEVMNLTSITEYNDVLIKHFADSLSIMQFTDFSTGKDKELSQGDGLDDNVTDILDIGTGAGFPGIPLKIFFPEKGICLVDSTEKKMNFVGDVCDELGLNNISLLVGRAEELAHQNEFRGQFQYVVSRAVASLSVLTELSLAFLKKGGHFVAYKSSMINEELDAAQNAIRTMGGKVEKVESFTIPESDFERSLVFIRKGLDTPKQYPRKASAFKKNPL